MLTKKKLLLPKLRFLYLDGVQKSILMANYVVNQIPILFPKVEKVVVNDYTRIFIYPEAFKDNIAKMKDGM